MSRRAFLAAPIALATAGCGDYGDSFSQYQAVGRPITRFAVIHGSRGLGVRGYIEKMLAEKTTIHYIIDRNGHVIELVPDGVVAWHSETSRWENHNRLSLYSVGIGFIGDGNFTSEQYEAFKQLYRGEKGIKWKYGLDDTAVVLNSWVSYCPDEKTHREKGLQGEHKCPHRGLETDPGLFNREAAGLAEMPEEDYHVLIKDILRSDSQTRLVVYPEQRELAVEQGREVKRYTVSVDRRGPQHIPKGKFAIKKKIQAPMSWFGKRYFDVSNGTSGFIVHGTPNEFPHTLNSWARWFMHPLNPGYNDWTTENVAMANEDIVELYGNIFLNTPVEVR